MRVEVMGGPVRTQLARPVTGQAQVAAASAQKPCAAPLASSHASQSVAVLVAASAPAECLRQRRVLSAAADALDRLERLHRLALAGATDPDSLAELANGLDGADEEPELAALLADIALRIRIEQAKSERR